MSALYGPNSINLPHINIFRWAQKNNVVLPVDFRRTKEQETLFLKYIANRDNYVQLSPALERARFSKALKEAMEYLPSSGLQDKTVIAFQIAGTIFFAVLFVAGTIRARL